MLINNGRIGMKKIEKILHILFWIGMIIFIIGLALAGSDI